MPMLSRRRVSLVVGLLVVAGCKDKDAPPAPVTRTQQMTAPGALAPLALQPLPEPPKLELAQETVPGARGPLQVVVARPRDTVKSEVRPTITFNKPVKSLQMVEEQRAGDAQKPFAKLEPALEGEWRWLGSASVEFVPKGLVPMATEYRVTVFKGLTALDGAALAEDYQYTFSTPRPAVQELNPVADFRWVKPEATFALLFNQPISVEQLEAHARFAVPNQPPLKVKVVSRVSIQEERRAMREAEEKAGRRFQGISDEARGWRNQQVRVTLAPERPLPLDAQVTLTLDAALTGEQGKLPLGTEYRAGWKVYGPLKLTGMRFCEGAYRCPYGPLVLEVTNEVDLQTLKGKVKVTPAVELAWDEAQSWAPNGKWDSDRSPYVAVPGKFKPGTAYTVTVDPGFGDVFKQSAQAGGTRPLKTDDLTPRLQPGPYEALLEALPGKEPTYPVEVANLTSLEVKAWKLTVPELVRAIQRDSYEARNTQVVARPADVSESRALKFPRNQGRVYGLQLGSVLGPTLKGAVLSVLDSPQLENHPKDGYRNLIQVTDLAVHTKYGPKKSLAWVTRLSTGGSVEGAEVQVYSSDAALLFSGKTDASGLVDIPALPQVRAQYAWQVPAMVVVASLADDTSATSTAWNRGVEAYEFGLAGAWEGEAPQNSGFLFTDRGVYRPGDTVELKGVVRYRSLGELKAPAEGSTLKVVVNDSRDNRAQQAVVKVSRYGTFSMKIGVSKDAALGFWSIEATGETPAGPFSINDGFRVEEYRAPQFRVDVELAKNALIAGEALGANVFARYLFGAPMRDAKAKWSVVRSSTSFSAAVAPDFTFAQETWWWDDDAPTEQSGFVASGDGAIDAKGSLAVAAGATEAPGGKPYVYALEAEVTDVNRQAVAGRAALTVHPAAFYVGLRSPVGFMQAGKAYGLDTLVVDVDGKKVAGRKLEVKVVSRSWKSVKKKDASGGFVVVSEPEEKEAGQCALVSGDGPVPCSFTPPTGGFYIARATVKDDGGRVHQASLGTYALGEGFVAWQRNDTDRIELVLDKPRYDVGDVAKVLVKSPYPQANAVFTVEREGVLERKLLKLEGSVTAVDLPITEDMVPNVFVGALLMRPRVAQGGLESGDDPGRPNARVGLVKLSVEKKAKRLTVAVKTDKADYRPGDEVTIDVEAKDFKGAGADGEVTLFVVDEAVLRLTAYATPDPIERIFQERGLSVRTGEPLLNLVRRRSFGEKGEAQGGGGGDEPSGKGFRSNFKTTVAFLPDLQLKGGRAQAKVKLPDNLTEFRVMAVVVTQAERFGSGEASLKVSKPVLALPALPRFARVGDRFEAGVVVHSKGAGAGEVTVTASAQGLVLEGPAEKKVQVAEGAPREVRFAFVAQAPGLATLRFKAVKGAESDGVEQKLPVELPLATEAVATYGDTTDSRVEGIVPPKGVREDSGGLKVTLSSTALTGFNEGFGQLIEYPYGCLEQQSSRLVPFVALREIAGQYKISWPTEKENKRWKQDAAWASLLANVAGGLDVSEEKNPDTIIRQTVKSISNLQLADGSFTYWPGGDCSNAWSSTYATLSLYRAREVGFAVPPEVMKNASSNLVRVVGGRCNACDFSCGEETRTFAAYVLARMKQPKASAYAELYAKREKLSLFGRALLANAMFVGGGDREKAKALLTELLNFAKESPAGLYFHEADSNTYATLFHSDTRTTGVVLQALTDIAPEHPYVGKLARYLTSVRQGTGQWRNTQEAAWSLIGLTQLLRTKEKDVPDYTSTVTYGAKALLSEAFKGRSLEPKVTSVPMAQLLSAGQGETKLTFKKEGTGVLYYTALLRYTPTALPMKSLDNGLFVQRWFEPFEGGGQALKFRAGELVRVRVRVATNQERHYAAIEVPLPAGLEPVDTSLATTARQPTSRSEEGAEGYEADGQDDESGGSADEENDSFKYRLGFWSPFNFTERRDNRVVYFADHLPAGVHVASFVARATTPGVYLAKPARGELMYAPEVWGRSDGATFEVVLPEQVSER